MQRSTRELVDRILRGYLVRYKKPALIGVVLMAAVAALSAAQAYLLQPAVDELLVEQNRDLLFLIPGAILAVFVAKGCANFGQSVFMTRAGMSVIRDIQNDLLEAILRFDAALMARDATGTLIARFISDCYQLREAIVKAFTGIARDFLVLVAMVGVMFWSSWQLSLGMLVLLPVVAITVSKIGKRIRNIAEDMQSGFGVLSAELDETFKGHREIKAYGRETFIARTIGRRFDELLDLVIANVRMRSLTYPFMETMAGLLIGSIVLAGALLVMNGEMTIGKFMSFLGATGMAAQPLRGLANLNTTLQHGLASANRIFDVLETEPGITAPDKPEPFPETVRDITFKDVSFGYAAASPVLHGVDLTVSAGERVALVGPSGAGKSTVLNLLQRLYDVSGGRIEINGTPITAFDPAELRRHIAVVSQSPFIFNGTVLDNLRFADPDAPEEQLIAAAKRAHLDEAVTAFPDGYATLVGEHGASLSGGQRQRLAIARALVRDAPIVLLDEITSDLDSRTERALMASLDTLFEGRLVLMIAHRLHTTRSADRLYLFDGGRVAAVGPHDRLIAESETYRTLFEGA